MPEIRLIEQFCAAKSPEESKNEDGCFVGKNFVAVVDGVTSKTQILTQGKLGGQILKDIVISTVEGLPAEADCVEAALAIQGRILASAPESAIGRASAAALIYSVHRRELWSVGDCQAVVGGKRYDLSKRIDAITSRMRAIAIQAMLYQGRTVEELKANDEAREIILPVLKLQSVYENRRGEYGYTVFNNTTPLKDFPADTIKIIPVKAGEEVVMATDGYPVLEATLALSEQRLAEVLKDDPLLFKKYPSTKGLTAGNLSFDDRTYVRFTAL